jgi:hypothetical protein
LDEVSCAFVFPFVGKIFSNQSISVFLWLTGLLGPPQSVADSDIDVIWGWRAKQFLFHAPQRACLRRVSLPAPFGSFYPLLPPTHKHGPVHAYPRSLGITGSLIYAGSVGPLTEEKQGHHTRQHKPFHITSSVPLWAKLYHSTAKSQQECHKIERSRTLPNATVNYSVVSLNGSFPYVVWQLRATTDRIVIHAAVKPTP